MARLLTRIAPTIALLLPIAAAVAGVPYPKGAQPAAIDIGALTSRQGAQTVTVTVAMRLHDIAGAKERLQSVSNPESSEFRKFITPEEFRAKYAPTDAEVARVTASLTKFGLSVTRSSSSLLTVTGTPDAFERAFQVSLHEFAVAARGTTEGYHYRAPLSHPVVPGEADELVSGVFGLSTQPQFRPHNHSLPNSVHHAPTAHARAADASTQFTQGTLTVSDFASLYGVNPLYAKGITGAGRTIGIVTLAGFTPSDAFAYWSAIGLTVDPNRIKVVNVDGGPGAPSDASGSDETTLDVEQSGGVAPGATVVVYQAPNTNQAYIDAFATAIDSNVAETISTSWGEWEWFDTIENVSVTNPNTGRTSSVLTVFDQLFLQAALQGQSLFAASGDSGAYDVNGESDSDGTPFLPPAFSLALSVDSPASDPFITAAGGTTLPGLQEFLLPDNSIFSVTLNHEQAWSWSYLNGLCSQLGFTPIACGIFPVGSGGGVSVFNRTPIYQFFLPGVVASQPHQAFIDDTGATPQVVFKLPANFPGRNVPDISANADPDTGYVVFYTSDRSGFNQFDFFGGTSFVAPQMNGVTSLLVQYLHGRVGLMNFPMYLIARTGGYSGPNAPFRAIKLGDNDFYTGSNGYNPAVGLGVMNAAGLAEAMKRLFR